MTRPMDRENTRLPGASLEIEGLIVHAGGRRPIDPARSRRAPLCESDRVGSSPGRPKPRVALALLLAAVLGLGAEGTCGSDDDADGDGWSSSQGDCDDTNPDVHLLAMDVLDGLDNDCDGVVDRPASLVAAGYGHGMGRFGEDGAQPGVLWSWGRNDEGELGDGTTTSRPAPAPVSGLSDLRHVSAGFLHTLAVDADGRLWAWGDNSFGQIGDGSTSTRTQPVQVSVLSDVRTAAAGAEHSLAVRSDGTVWAWGSNEYGQLGLGDSGIALVPTQISSLINVVAVAAGADFSLALRADGTVWAWGNNENGQLGTGGIPSSNFPVQVGDLANVVAVAAGTAHGLALVDDGGSGGGTVWAWGWNWGGQLGDGTTVDRTRPVRSGSLTDVVAIAAGGAHSMAIRSRGDGRYGALWCWGLNYAGQVGDGTARTRTEPVLADVPGDVVAVAGGFDWSLAMTTGGEVWAWGSNESGQMGLPSSSTNDYLAHPVVGLSSVAWIEAGRSFSVALLTDGTVWSWGMNHVGSLGQGDTGDIQQPSRIAGLSNITAISVGYEHTLALGADGTVWAWGQGLSGELGNGDTENQDRPVQVVNMTEAVAVAAGYDHSLAIVQPASGGETEVWAWGSNYGGQLGNGTTQSTSTPVQVAGLTGVIALAAGETHSLALRSDGTLWAWGRNDKGQLGTGTGTDSSVPVRVPLDQVVAIGAGPSSSFAAQADGTGWAWGTNYTGQLGDGTTEWRYSPVQISGMNDLAFIDGGYMHTVAARSDGTGWAWGANNYGQLGQGTVEYNVYQLTPLQVPYLEDIVQVSGGFDHSVARTATGEAWAWGANSNGQLGNGAVTALYEPAEVAGLP